MDSETPGAGPALPARTQMMRAVCGVAGADDPVLCAAHELAALHERREQLAPGDTSEIDWERARLVCEIDRWVILRSPRPATTAPLHTESLGAVVDRMAQFAALTYRALATGADPQLRVAQQRLHELSCGYADLVTEITTGTRRLPDPDPRPSHHDSESE